jgi:hypothetical protein
MELKMKIRKYVLFFIMEFKIGDIVRINTVSQISNQGKWSDGTFMDGEVTEKGMALVLFVFV